MNTSIASILISSIALFFNSVLLSKLEGRFKKYWLVVSFIFLIALLLYFGGRSGIVGITMATIYLWHQHYPSSLLKKKRFLIVIIISLFTVLFFVKQDSSKGRLLIYKVTFSQLKANDYIYGLGLGKFKAVYNQLQANYFMQNDMNSKEALLAGNGYYLFNDWLQVVLEIGLIGMCILGICIGLFFKLYKWKPTHKALLIAANAVLICIGTAALFNYPLQTVSIFGLFVVCIIIHFYYAYQLRTSFQHHLFIGLKNTVLLLLSILSICYGTTIYNYKKKATLAFELSRDGYKNEADRIFKQLDKTNFADYNCKYNYASLFYFKNNLAAAEQKIDEALQLAYSVEGVKLKADILYEQHKITEAEKYYLQAVYIVPNRMLTKYTLMQFYKQTHQLKKAKYWATVILKMPIKIPSATTEELLKRTQIILQEIENFNNPTSYNNLKLNTFDT